MQNLKGIIPVFILLLYFFTSCSISEEEKIIKVEGVLIDKLSKVGAPNVEMEVTSKHVAGRYLNFSEVLATKKVITDSNGNFSVKLPYKYDGASTSIRFYKARGQNGTDNDYFEMYYSFTYEQAKNNFLELIIERL